MKALIEKYRKLLQSIPLDFVRGFYDQINWEARAISIEGARGTGKSTLMLQRIKLELDPGETLYASLDDLYFKQHSLSEVTDTFVKEGGKYLFLDEVHKYPDWQREVKNCYDFNPTLQMVVSGSSLLALQKSSVDLSRRVLRYNLPELSFREYLQMREGIELPVFSLKTILDDHEQVAEQVLRDVSYPLKNFKHYLQYGAYPFFVEGENDFWMRINQLINVIIDYDLPEARAIEQATQVKLKRLLYIVSTSVPFKPNIAKLATQLKTSRNRILEMLHVLESARLIRQLRSSTQGVSLMNKPDKLFLNNTSLIYALAEGQPNVGNIRETFFMSALQNAGHAVGYPKKGDFKVDEQFVFEVGGKNKSHKQIAELENAYVAADDIELGYQRTIPLWLFGLLY